MLIAKKYVVVSPFEGVPKKSDFAIVEEKLAALNENDFLLQAAYFSVDPYQRVKLGTEFPCDMIGGQIAKVIESRNTSYPVGTWIMAHFGWRTHTVVTPDSGRACACAQIPFMYRLPDFGDLPVSLALGVCGRVGNTAYFGFTEICRPQPGDTVVVSGAAGAVGSHVGQIAKILGMSSVHAERCKVIGLAGSKEKCDWLVKDLGFDVAGNYKTVDLVKFLKESAPNGIDCYFDNVGGEISSTVLSQMNRFGRVAVCGAIAGYNETDPQKRKATFLQPYIVAKELKIEGFQVNRFADRTQEGINRNLQWVKEGKLQYREHVTPGFENTVDAFIGMFNGENTGKTLVQII